MTLIVLVAFPYTNITRNYSYDHHEGDKKKAGGRCGEQTCGANDERGGCVKVQIFTVIDRYSDQSSERGNRN